MAYDRPPAAAGITTRIGPRPPPTSSQQLARRLAPVPTNSGLAQSCTETGRAAAVGAGTAAGLGASATGAATRGAGAGRVGADSVEAAGDGAIIRGALRGAAEAGADAAALAN